MARAVRTSTIASDVYGQIRTDIITSTLRPGSKLNIERLREKYDVGISPVREALNRLSAEGLVAVEDLKGFNVPAVSIVEFRELARTSQLINGLVLREAMDRSTEEWRDSVIIKFFHLSRTPVAAQDDPRRFTEEWELRHRAFHAALFAGCASRYLVRFCSILLDMSDRYRHLYLAWGGSAAEIEKNHQVIVDAVLAQNSMLLEQQLKAFPQGLEDFFLSSGALES